MKTLRIILVTIVLVGLCSWLCLSGCNDDDDDETYTGILNIWTTPVAGDIYVNGEYYGQGNWQGELPVGTYAVSFGELPGYSTPDEVQATVHLNQTTPVEGKYIITFIKTFGGNLEACGRSVQQTSDGGYIIAGYTFSSSGSKTYLVKTDSMGSELWSQTYGWGSGYNVGNSVQQTSEGGYIIVGSTDIKGLTDVLLIKTDSSGNELWSYIFGGTQDDGGYAVRQTADGGYIITGYTYSLSGHFGYRDVYLIKTDSTGHSLWQRNFGGGFEDWGESVQQTSDGGFIITGLTEFDYGTSNKVYLIKTDQNGYEIWSKKIGEGRFNRGHSVQQCSDGGYIVSGRITFSTDIEEEAYLIKTDSNGNVLWTNRFRSAATTFGNTGYSVQETSDGGFIIGGSTEPQQTVHSVYLIKTDNLGTEQWSKIMNISGAFDYGSCVQQTSDSGFVIAGSTSSNNHDQVLLIKTDPNGDV